MKYIRQFGIILLISLVGELLHQWLPLPVPASIYGIILLFLCLERKVVSLASVKEASSFLIEIMPVMFIPAAAGLMDSWPVIRTSWVSYGAITIISTVVVMAVSGRVVQAVMKLEKGRKKTGNEGEG